MRSNLQPERLARRAAASRPAKKTNLVDSNGAKVFTPVPANQIDTSATGYVVARNGTLPSNNLCFST